MSVPMINWNEDYILQENIDLTRINKSSLNQENKVCKPTVLVHLSNLPSSYPSFTNFIQKKELK